MLRLFRLRNPASDVEQQTDTNPQMVDVLGVVGRVVFEIV